MKKAKDNNKSSSTVFSGIWGTVLMTLLITIAFGILIYGMYITDFISVIDFSAVIANKKEEGNVVNNDVVYDILKNESDLYEFVYESTPGELTDIISGFVSPEEYTFKSTVVSSGQLSTDLVELSAVRSKDGYAIEKRRDGILFETVKLDNDGYITVTDELRDRFATHVNGDGIEFEAQCGIPSLNDLAGLCRDIINNNSDVDQYTVSLVSKDGIPYYYVSFVYNDIIQKEEFYLSTENCMITDAYTYIGDTLVYRYHLDEYAT